MKSRNLFAVAMAVLLPMVVAPLARAQAATDDKSATTPTTVSPTEKGDNVDSDHDRKGSRRVLRVAVYDLSVSGVDKRIASVVNELLLVELRKLERVSVIGYSEIRTLLDLEAERQAAGCDSEESCLAEVADALGTDILITGTLARVGEDHVFGLKILDQGQAKAGRSFNKITPAVDGSEFLGHLGPAVEALFPTIAVKPGVKRGVSEEAVRRLTPPPVPAWAFWSGVGLSSVALFGSVVAAVVQFSFYSLYVQDLEASTTRLVDGGQVVAAGNLAVASEIIGWSLLGGGILIGAVTAAAYPLTNFEGGEE